MVQNVYRYLRGFTASEQLAEELTAETFLKALHSINEIGKHTIVILSLYALFIVWFLLQGLNLDGSDTMGFVILGLYLAFHLCHLLLLYSWAWPTHVLNGSPRLCWARLVYSFRLQYFTTWTPIPCG